MGGGVKSKISKMSGIVSIDSSVGLMPFGGTDDGSVQVIDS